ncbi:MAG: SdrD B-like domain-containing protein [Rhodocyclaceae bacterium]|nr:SdrD B-like domain-containing protein [Rhodocyclaceae bacterium]
MGANCVRFLGSIVLGAMLLAGEVGAATDGPYSVYTVPQTDSLSLVPWSTTVAVPRFNPALGTLNSAEVVLSGAATISGTLTNNNTLQARIRGYAPFNDYLGETVTLTLQKPDTTTLQVAYPANTYSPPSPGITLAPTGNPGDSVAAPVYTLSAPNSDVIYLATSPGDVPVLDLLTGVGTVTLPINSGGTSAYSGPNNVTYAPVGRATGTVTVTYTYTAQPPTVAKAFLPVGIPQGGTSMLTITLTNPNTAVDSVLAADMVDDLPAHVLLAGTPNLRGTCLSGGYGTATLTPGGGTAGRDRIAYPTGAKIPMNSNCTIILDVIGNLGSSLGTAYTNTIAVGALQTNTGNNATKAEAILTVYTGSISGRVWQDAVSSVNATYNQGTDVGALQLGGHNGVWVDLYQWVNGAWSVVNNTTFSAYDNTATGGNYSFTGLAPGTYMVVERGQPDGTIHEVTQAGSSDGVGVGTAVGTTGTCPGGAPCGAGAQVVQNIVLGYVTAAGTSQGQVGNMTGVNFVERISASASISGRVYYDASGDHNPATAPNVGIPGVTVRLRDSGTNAQVGSDQVTNGTGDYSFTGLVAGNYYVQEIQPAAWLDGTDTVGTGGSAPKGTIAKGGGTVGAGAVDAITNIAIGSNETLADYNFGELAGTTLSGAVFVDNGTTGGGITNDGLKNGTEAGISGVLVTLNGSSGGTCVTQATPPAFDTIGTSCTTRTAADGSYSFVIATTGVFNVVETQPSGYLDGTTRPGTGTTGYAGAPPSKAVPVSPLPGSVNPGDPDAINGVVIAARETAINYNFGEQPTVVTLTKSFSAPKSILANGTSTMTLTLGNPNGAVATVGTQDFVDTFPANLAVAATSNLASGIGTGTGTGMCRLADVSATNTGSTGTLTVKGTTAGGTYQIPANGTCVITVNVTSAAAGTYINTTGTLYTDKGTAPPATDTLVVTAPQAIISGHVWLNKTPGQTTFNASNVIPLKDWIVQVLDGENTVAGTGTTASDGSYGITVAPGIAYHVQFKNPATGQVWPGVVNNAPASACATCTENPNRTAITGVQTPGGSIPGLDLPIDPSGVVYDSRTGTPISGALVTLSGPPGFAAYVAGGNTTYTTGADGAYQFFFLAGAPTGTYTLSVTAPNYLPVSPASASTVVVPCANALNVYAGTVGGTTYPDPSKIQNANWTAARLALGPAPSCPASNSGFVAGSATTLYYLSFAVQNGWSNLINNHIPMDPGTGNIIVMTKTTPMVNVARGDLVPYTLTARNTASYALTGMTIVDRMPPGFKYRTGSATLDGVPMEPTASGRDLSWTPVAFVANNSAGTVAGATRIFKLLLIPGSGVGDGLYDNCTWARAGASAASNQACAPVRIVPDPTFDCPDVIGKVFDDKNANGYQDDGEPGIPNVRIATPRGVLVTSDAEGRFHVPCPEIPNPDRGSNFFMKLDDRTLPSGYRLTTENPRDVRLTRGKLVKLNFGATIHRVVRIELTDAAFVAGREDLLPDWQKKIEALPRQLTDKPSLIRIAYPPGGDPDLTKKRIEVLKAQIEKHWQDLNCCYRLVIETEGEQ